MKKETKQVQCPLARDGKCWNLDCPHSKQHDFKESCKDSEPWCGAGPCESVAEQMTCKDCPIATCNTQPCRAGVLYIGTLRSHRTSCDQRTSLANSEPVSEPQGETTLTKLEMCGLCEERLSIPCFICGKQAGLADNKAVQAERERIVGIIKRMMNDMEWVIPQEELKTVLSEIAKDWPKPELKEGGK